MPELEEVDQYPGHLEAQISLHLIFSLWGYINLLAPEFFFNFSTPVYKM